MLRLQQLAALPLRAFMHRANRGLYAGKEIQFGNNVSHSERKTRRTWKPNVQVRAALVLPSARRGGGEAHPPRDARALPRSAWHPAGPPCSQNKTFFSELLGRAISLRATTHALRWIEKAGGFDRYILHTPDRKLASNIASELKLELQAALAEHPGASGASAAGTRPPVQQT